MDDGANGAKHGVKVTEPLLPPAHVLKDGSKRSSISHSDGGLSRRNRKGETLLALT